MKDVNRSKRLVHLPPSKVALLTTHLEWVEALVFRFLLSDVLPDGGLVSACREDVVATRPEVRARAVGPPPKVAAGEVNGASP